MNLSVFQGFFRGTFGKIAFFFLFHFKNRRFFYHLAISISANGAENKKQKGRPSDRPFDVRVVLSSRAVASQVLSPFMSLTTVFGMGTGVPSSPLTRTQFNSQLAANIFWLTVSPSPVRITWQDSFRQLSRRIFAPSKLNNLTTRSSTSEFT